MEWKQITPEQISGNLFERIGKQWFLLTAGTPENWNTMTCSWGMGGVMWNRPSVTCYVRQSRHTFGFMQQQDMFTISFFPEAERKKLAFCGSHSGRDCDKAKEAGLTPETLGALFEEMDAQQTLEARIYKALDRMEAIQSHNESDPATWLPLEYELNLTYGVSNAAFHPYLKDLRAEMLKDTEAIIADAKARGIAPEGE